MWKVFLSPSWAKSAPPSCTDMWWRRIVYLASLLCCLVFYSFYREWFSWFLLVSVVTLPWFSLLISLPGMLTVKANLRCPESVRLGTPMRTALQLKALLPAPPLRCTIRLENSLNGERYLGKPGERIPTDHCGLITISYPHMFVYDYLGLFSRRLHREESKTIYILPKPIAGTLPALSDGAAVGVLRPKPGGGYSEHHDLRLYRPGDELRHIHWKMTAKTGKLIYREPMEPALKGHVLTVSLFGTSEQLDQKLGKLLWTCQNLLQQDQPHEVRCLTGKGILQFSITDNHSLEQCIHTLLSTPKALEDESMTTGDVLWHHHIGGESHEA